jgi:hypothetical protein
MGRKVVTGNGEKDIEQRKEKNEKKQLSQWHQGTQPKTTGHKGQIPGQ